MGFEPFGLWVFVEIEAERAVEVQIDFMRGWGKTAYFPWDDVYLKRAHLRVSLSSPVSPDKLN